MRLRFTAEMIDDNGERISMPVEIETAVPNLEEYGDKSRFYEIFDQYEKAALEARNQVAEGITEGYLNAAAASKKGKRREKARDRGGDRTNFDDKEQSSINLSILTFNNRDVIIREN